MLRRGHGGLWDYYEVRLKDIVAGARRGCMWLGTFCGACSHPSRLVHCQAVAKLLRNRSLYVTTGSLPGRDPFVN